MKIVLLFFASGLGALSRYSFYCLLGSKPLVTILINVVGSFLIGFFYGRQSVSNFSDIYWLMIATGFLGGFTTFSTFSLDMLKFIEGQGFYLFLSYLFLSVLGGLLAVYAGYLMSRFYI